MMMRTFVSALVLALLWMLLFGTFDLTSLAAGLVVGLGAILFSRPIVGSKRDEPTAVEPRRGEIPIAWRLWSFVRLAGLYSYELVVTNLMMVRDVLRPHSHLEPAIFALEVPELGPSGTALLSNLITLTPGSLVVDFDERSETLYIHTIYAGEIETMKRDYRRFARQIYRALGRKPPRAVSEAS